MVGQWYPHRLCGVRTGSGLKLHEERALLLWGYLRDGSLKTTSRPQIWGLSGGWRPSHIPSHWPRAWGTVYTQRSLPPHPSTLELFSWPGKFPQLSYSPQGKESESEVAQSCPTLSGPVDCSLPGSSLHGIFQARILEWVAISFSRASSQPRDRTEVSLIGGRRFNLWATRDSKTTTDGDCSHEIKRCLLLGRKVMTNLHSILKKQRHYFANKCPSS